MKKRANVLMVSLLIFLFPAMAVGGEMSRITRDLDRREVFFPSSAPQRDRLVLLSFDKLILEGEVIGALAVYDDPTTKRLGDYLELYNRAGELLIISWFDRFGIQRTAMDRGLLEGTSRLEGVLVLLPEVEPV